MANLDAIWFPGMILFLYAVKYWWLLLAIILVVVATILILRKKKKQLDQNTVNSPADSTD